MQARDAAFVLSAIARGGAVELAPGMESVLEGLHSGGWIRPAPDPGAERSRMATLREDLARIGAARAAGDASADLPGRERGLRSAILELSAELASSEGAAEVRLLSGGGPYRGIVGGGERFQLTQRGRALLSDLAPRLARAGAGTLGSFEAEMRGLREAFAWRAERAAQIAARIRQRETLGAARYAVPVGLSAVRAPVEQIARAFDVTFAALRARPDQFSAEQDAAAAECLCLVAPDVAACERPEPAAWFHALRADILRRHVQGNPEDALDAAALLTGVPEHAHAGRIELARELATDVRARGGVITLSLSLIALAGEEQVPPHLPAALAQLDRMLAREISNPNDRIITAVLLGSAHRDLPAQLEVWRTLRTYLARFAVDGMAVAAALLSWLSLEPGEILDDLRLASAELTKHRMAEGAAETMAHAIKLLVGMAALAAGAEGDHEEGLALAPAASLRLPQLGLHAAFAALPLATAAVTTFHRTVLDAAVEWERTHHPTHPSYVYGRSRSFGWG